jgi:hypothetical protein
VRLLRDTEEVAEHSSWKGIGHHLHGGLVRAGGVCVVKDGVADLFLQVQMIA